MYTPPAVGPPAGHALLEGLQRVLKSAIVLFLVLVSRGRRSRVAPFPEFLDERLLLSIRLQRQKPGPFLLRNDPDHLLLQPLLIVGLCSSQEERATRRARCQDHPLRPQRLCGEYVHSSIDREGRRFADRLRLDRIAHFEYDGIISTRETEQRYRDAVGGATGAGICEIVQHPLGQFQLRAVTPLEEAADLEMRSPVGALECRDCRLRRRPLVSGRGENGCRRWV